MVGRGFLIGLAVACVSAPLGCYWSSPPTAPHGLEQLNPEQIPVLTVSPDPVRLRSPRVLILGRFDSRAIQPIGGVYDLHDGSISPLVRTYYFKFGHLELFEHACDALRASGLDVRKDYATTGEPWLVESGLRQKDPLLIRARVIELQHDQVRSDDDPPRDSEVIKLVTDVGVFDTSGNGRYQARHAIYGRVVVGEDIDVLRMLGLKLGERLVHDAAFVRAIEAVRGAGS